MQRRLGESALRGKPQQTVKVYGKFWKRLLDEAADYYAASDNRLEFPYTYGCAKCKFAGGGQARRRAESCGRQHTKEGAL